ncbi:NAD(P)-binding protein [Parathielavia appendiculata]|uniref:NAD(P)-binding protein n=1 Tax=Parathielavia appendiculata TaxID=2587402 RepID=A0AAN6U3I1_9PEZI|nr:NAD(P)-binding protein [Parathielavia appendiculata]
MAPRVWHISGANTGFGLELSLKALKEGDRIIAAVRSPSKVPDSLKVDGVKVLQYDLSFSQEEVNAYAEKAFGAFGRVDVLVNNAAYAYMGAIEETEDEMVKKQFDINVFGVLRTIRAFLPHMRSQKSGTIANISSIGGLRGYPSNGVYCATKFALEGITQALAAEIAPFGLHAFVIEPGYFRTAFLSSVASASAASNLAPPLAVYDGTIAHEARANFERFNGRQLGNPVEGAARIWEYVAGEGLFKGKEKRLRLPLGSDTGGAMRALSESLAETANDYEEIWSSTDFKE